MGFLTIWFFLISTFFSCSFLIRKYSPFKTFFFSFLRYTLFTFSFFFSVSFAYQEFFLYFLLLEAKTPFYISDLNLLSYHLFRNISLFAGSFFFPFVLQGISRGIKAFFTSDEIIPRYRFVSLLIYVHIVSLWITQYDLFQVYIQYFTESYPSWFEGIDYNSFVNLYWGTYYDLYLFLLSPWIFIHVVSERIYFRRNNRYTFDVGFNSLIDISKAFWSIFYFFWMLRIFFHMINLYFFIGGGLISDFIVTLTAFVTIEFFIGFFRLLLTLYAWKAL